jgi:hypothetical protein
MHKDTTGEFSLSHQPPRRKPFPNLLMLSEAKHLPANQRAFAEFILGHRRAQGDNEMKSFSQVH